MKTQTRSLLLLALATLLVKAQTSSKLSYEDTILGLFAKKDAEGRTFRPLLEELQVDTLSPYGVDGSAVSMKSLTFNAQETTCSGTQEQRGKPCPLKQKGQLLLCNLVVSHPVQDISNIIITSEMACKQLAPEDALKQKIRTRRSKSGKGNGGSKGSKGSKGGRGGSRPGGGSSIAGGGNKGNTRTA